MKQMQKFSNAIKLKKGGGGILCYIWQLKLRFPNINQNESIIDR